MGNCMGPESMPRKQHYIDHIRARMGYSRGGEARGPSFPSPLFRAYSHKRPGSMIDANDITAVKYPDIATGIDFIMVKFG